MFIIELIIKVISAVFPYSLATKILHLYTKILCKTSLKTYCKTLEKTIQVALPNEPAASHQHIAKSCIHESCRFILEYTYFSKQSSLKNTKKSNSVKIEGLHNLEQAIESNQPVIVVSIHMGDFLYGLLKLSQIIPKNKKISIVKYNEASTKEKNAYQSYQNLGLQFEICRLSQKPALELLRTLRNGNIVFMMCDVHPSLGKTMPVNFFGKPALFPSGPAELALMSKAIILPLVCANISESIVLTIEKPILPTQTLSGSLSNQSQEKSQELAKQFEGWIRKHPEQWQFWGLMEDLWKTA